MVQFNAYDHKYRCCCCGIHVTTLARVFIILSTVGYILELCVDSSQGLFNPKLTFLPIAILGTYAVFQEARTPLIFYIIIGVLYSILFIAITFIRISSFANGRSQIAEYFFFPIAVFVCFTFAIIQLCIFKTYWNFVTYIADRERAQKAQEQYQEILNRPTSCAVPSAPPVELGAPYEPPPPYSAVSTM